jgi:hypothetical protein
VKLYIAGDRIFRMLSRVNHQASDAECDTLERTIAYYFNTWHSELPDQPISVKLHILARHTMRTFRETRCTGDFAEEPIESSHHIEAAKHRTYAGIADWTQRMRHIHKGNGQARNEKVVAHTAAVHASAKRKFKDSSRGQAEAADREAKRLRRDEDLNKAIAEWERQSSPAYPSTAASTSAAAH